MFLDVGLNFFPKVCLNFCVSFLFRYTHASSLFHQSTSTAVAAALFRPSSHPLQLYAARICSSQSVPLFALLHVHARVHHLDTALFAFCQSKNSLCFQHSISVCAFKHALYPRHYYVHNFIEDLTSLLHVRLELMNTFQVMQWGFPKLKTLNVTFCALQWGDLLEELYTSACCHKQRKKQPFLPGRGEKLLSRGIQIWMLRLG